MNVETSHLPKLLYLNQVIHHVNDCGVHANPLVPKDDNSSFRELELVNGHGVRRLFQGY